MMGELFYEESGRQEPEQLYVDCQGLSIITHYAQPRLEIQFHLLNETFA